MVQRKVASSKNVRLPDSFWWFVSRLSVFASSEHPCQGIRYLRPLLPSKDTPFPSGNHAFGRGGESESPKCFARREALYRVVAPTMATLPLCRQRNAFGFLEHDRRSEVSAEAEMGRKAGTDQGTTVARPWLREFQKASARRSPCGSLREVCEGNPKASHPHPFPPRESTPLLGGREVLSPGC